MSINRPKETLDIRAKILRQVKTYTGWRFSNFETAANFFAEKANELGMTEPVITLEQAGKDTELFLRDNSDIGEKPHAVHTGSDEYKKYLAKVCVLPLTKDEYADLNRNIELERQAIDRLTK